MEDYLAAVPERNAPTKQQLLSFAATNKDLRGGLLWLVTRIRLADTIDVKPVGKNGV